MQDNRKSVRISTDMKLVSRSSGNSIDSRLMNLSSGGMFIKTSHLLPVDALFRLSLQLPEDTELIPITGRVVWTKSVSNQSPPGMGIEFVDMLPAHQKKISDFIERALRAKSDIDAVKLFL